MDDSAPLLRHIKPTGMAQLLAALPLIVTLSFCMGLMLSVQSIYSNFFKKNTIKSTIDEAEAQKALADFTHDSITASDGVQLHALTMGPRVKSKPCMLFLHGFPECSYSWRHQMRHFSESHNVIAIDIRGYGKSDKPQSISSYTLDILVADVVAVIRSLGPGSQKIVLVGHDWGGIIAWLVAAMHPELLSSLIVLAAPHLGVASLKSNISLTQAIKSWYILFFQCPLLPEWMLTRDGCSFLHDVFMKAPMGLKNPDHMTEIDIEILKQSFRESGTAAATLNTYRALFANATYRPSETTWHAMRQRVRVPVLLLWAEDDAALGLGMTNGIDQVVEDLEMKVLKNCSHWIQQDQPHMTNILMADFLARRQSI